MHEIIFIVAYLTLASFVLPKVPLLLALLERNHATGG